MQPTAQVLTVGPVLGHFLPSTFPWVVTGPVLRTYFSIHVQSAS